MVEKTIFDNCWIWTGATDGRNYGQIHVKGKTRRLPRVSYILFYGCIPDTVDHLCSNKRCWNPDHLESVTQLVNVRRAADWYQTEDGSWFCPFDHEMTPQNTFTRTNGVRCRRCHNDYKAQWRAERGRN